MSRGSLFFKKNLSVLLVVIFFQVLFGSCKNKNINIPDDMILIPEGKFIMGSNEIEKSNEQGEFKMKLPIYADEYPEHKIFLKSFLIDRFEVTNLQYSKFDISRKYSSVKKNHPVTALTWFDAKKYCDFAGKRLPSAPEWEKAARGPEGNIYPWGNIFEIERANTGRAAINNTTPVGIYEKGKSHYAVYDMIGNIAEWTSDWYEPYEGSKFRSQDFGKKFREIRGSSFGGLGHYKLSAFDRASYRRKAEPTNAVPDVGIRCAKDI